MTAADFDLPTDNLRCLAAAVADHPHDTTPRGAFLDCLGDEAAADEEWPLVLGLIRRHPGPDGFRLLAADWYERRDDLASKAMSQFVRAEVGRGRRWESARAEAAFELTLDPDESFGGRLYLGHQHRGFVSELHCEYPAWAAHGDALVATQPLDGEVRLTTWPDLRVVAEEGDRVRVAIDGPPRAELATETMPKGREESSLDWAGTAAAKLVRRLWPTVRFSWPESGRSLVLPAPAIHRHHARAEAVAQIDLYGDRPRPADLTDRYVYAAQRRMVLVRAEAAERVIEAHGLRASPRDVSWVEGRFGELGAAVPAVILCDCYSDPPAALSHDDYVSRPADRHVRLVPEPYTIRENAPDRPEWAVRVGECPACRRVYVAVDRVR